MTTVTHLEQFRLHNRPLELSQLDTRASLRALWGDAVATVAIVVLASTLIFEALRLLIHG
jgi:hypothetical protein